MSGDIKEKQVLVGEVSTPATVDKSLKKNGFAADAAEVGRRLEVLEERLNVLNPVTAMKLIYDNSESALEADNVQSAIDEVLGEVVQAVSKVEESLEDTLSQIDDKMDDCLKVEDKPSGTYTGDGVSAVERVIDIGSKGNVLIVYSKGYNLGVPTFAQVSPIGAFSRSGSGGSASEAFFGSGVAKFEDGKLTLKTHDASLNRSGVEYHYQVL